MQARLCEVLTLLGYPELTRLALERCATARAAIDRPGPPPGVLNRL